MHAYVTENFAPLNSMMEMCIRRVVPARACPYPYSACSCCSDSSRPSSPASAMRSSASSRPMAGSSPATVLPNAAQLATSASTALIPALSNPSAGSPCMHYRDASINWRWIAVQFAAAHLECLHETHLQGPSRQAVSPEPCAGKTLRKALATLLRQP